LRRIDFKRIPLSPCHCSLTCPLNASTWYAFGWLLCRESTVQIFIDLSDGHLGIVAVLRDLLHPFDLLERGSASDQGADFSLITLDLLELFTSQYVVFLDEVFREFSLFFLFRSQTTVFKLLSELCEFFRHPCAFSGGRLICFF